MRRCARCILPETVCGISFDEEGICSFCHAYRKESYLGREVLDQIVAASRSAGGQYDCIVPLSGGRDSTYVLYLAKARYNLRVLAVNHDNEFRTDQALANMQAACQRLNVELLSIRSKRDVVRKVVKCSLRCSVIRKLFRVCRACTYGFMSAAYRAADKYRVPLIFAGDSQPESVRLMCLQASKGLRLRKRQAWTFVNPDYYMSKYYLLMQRLEFPVRGNSCLRDFPRLRSPGVKEIRVFDYIPWDRRLIKETITSQLGWKKPVGHISSWRTDCKLTRFVDFCFFRMHGCTKACFGYSQMINGGHMDRDEALSQEEQALVAIRKGTELRALLEDEIGLSRRQASKILSTGRK